MSKANLALLPTHHVKLLSVGELECGKTCLIKRYCEQRFEPLYVPTIGIDYGIKKLRDKHAIFAAS